MHQHTMPAIIDLNARTLQRHDHPPKSSHRRKGIDAYQQASHQENWQQQQRYWQQHQPHQKEWNDAREKTAADPVLDPNRASERNHDNVSSSLIASSALISPRCNRSRISMRVGIGLVSTNSRLLPIRFSRALIVG